MKTLQFNDFSDFNKWRVRNDIYRFYDKRDERPSCWITEDEVDKLTGFEERYNVNLIEYDGCNNVRLSADLNDRQYKLFCDTHCVKLCLEYNLRESAIIIAGEYWDKIYDNGRIGTFEAVEECLDLAEKFEQAHNWFIFCDDCDYLESLEDFCDINIIRKNQKEEKV